jgi:hypothetical protein
MASRKNSKPADDLHIEEIDDSLPEPRANTAARWARSNMSAGKGASEALLFQTLGALGLAVGLVLWAGAPFQSTLADAAKALSSVNLHPSTLLVGGLLLYCFGRVRKSQVEQSRYLAGKDDGLLEQVAAAQVHTRNALEKLAHSQSAVQSALEEQHRALRHDLQQLAAASARKEDDGAAQEAIFRLAASLDQLGARVEQRMQAQYETFQVGLQQVGNEIVTAQNDLRELFAHIPAVLPAEPSDPFSEPLPQGEPAASPAQADRSNTQPPRSTPRPAQLPNEPISSLGVLDNISDEGAALPSPIRRVPQGSFSSEPPEPRGSIVKENTPAERALELDTHTKLTQLSDLLADDRLRAALEDMRRNG